MHLVQNTKQTHNILYIHSKHFVHVVCLLTFDWLILLLLLLLFYFFFGGDGDDNDAKKYYCSNTNIIRKKQTKLYHEC